MEPLQWVRVISSVVGALLLALAIHRRRRLLELFREFFLEPQPAFALGLMRAVFFGILFYNAVFSPASWYASISNEFVKLPPGWGWTGSFIPLSVGWTRALEIVLVVSSLLATLGLFTRPACIVASVVGIYVFGVPNFYFKIGHGMHVPLLSAMVIAASPAGDGFSLDALYRRFRGAAPPPSSIAYGLPIRFCWLLLGTMYLFPGLWKLWAAGDLYLDGTSLRATLVNKWIDQASYRPLMRPDRVPGVLPLLGIGTLVLEIGLFFALFQRRLRVIGGLGASVFHIGIGLTTDIWFNPLHPLIVLVDFPYVQRLRVIGPLCARIEKIWMSLAGRIPVRESSGASLVPRRSARASAVVGSTLVLAMFVTGTIGLHTWPVSVYPMFAKRLENKRSRAKTFVYAIVSEDGSEREIEPSFHPMEDTSGMRRVITAVRKYQLNGSSKGQVYLDLVARFVRENSGPFEHGDRLRIYEYVIPVDPDERDGKRRQQKLVAETPL